VECLVSSDESGKIMRKFDLRSELRDLVCDTYVLCEFGGL